MLRWKASLKPAAGSSAVTITDDFNRSDTLLESVATDEGWYWVNGKSSPDTMSVVSNKARVTNANDSTAYYANYNLGPNAEVQVTVTNEWPSNTSGSNVSARYTDIDNRYRVHRREDQGDWRLYKVVAGTSTEIGTRYSASPTPPYTLKLVCDGDQISVYIDDVLRIGPVTDTSITTGDYVAIGGYNNGGNRIELDDFVASSLSSGGGITLETSAENSGHTGYSSPYNLPVNYPAVSTNDIMLMVVSTERRKDFTGTPPTGWTKVIEQDGDNSYNPTQGFYWKRATGSASASNGNTWSSFFSTPANYYVWVGAYSGCDTSGSPIDASAGSSQAYGSSWSQSITTQTNNAMILAVAGTDKQDHTYTWTDGTELVDTIFNSQGTVSINEKVESTSGATTRQVAPGYSVSGTMTAVALRSAASTSNNFDFTVTTTTSSETFTIPCNTGTFDATVDWGDGSTSAITAYNDADLAHTYATAGDHNISISGTFPNIYFNDGSDKTKVKSVTNLGSVGWTSLKGSFKGCSNMTSFDAGDCDTSSVTSTWNMFNGCSSLTSLNLSSFDTSSVTTMREMFYNCSSLTSLNVSNFDTSSVTGGYAMENTFRGCSSITSLDLTSFDISSVTGLKNTFRDCSSLTSLNVSNFNTSSVTTMDSTFYGCSSLTSLDLTSFNTSSVTNILAMFQGCSSLTSLDLSNFDTSGVTGTNMWRMFLGCSSLTSLDITSFDTSGVTYMREIFRDCSSLTSLDLSNFYTSSANNMYALFRNCSSLTSLDVSNFDTSSVTTMRLMFQDCSSLTSLDVTSFNTSSVTDMRNMFTNCSLTTITGIEDFDITAVSTDYMTSFLNSATLSTAVYDELLVNWEGQTGYNNQNPSFGSSTYTSGSAAATARAALVTAGWTITDGGTA